MNDGCTCNPFLGERSLQACPVHCEPRKFSVDAALVGEVGNHHECFIVSMPEGKKVVGGTCNEVSGFWFEHVKKPHVSWAQLVLRDGTVLDDNDMEEPAV